MTTRAISLHGGMERYIHALAKHLVEQGIAVTLITPPNSAFGFNNKEIKNILIKPSISSTPLFHMEYGLFSLNAGKYLKKQNFDILHGFGATALGYLMLKGQMPTIVQAFGNEPCKATKIVERLYNLPMVAFLRYCMDNADAIASEGNMQTDEIIRLFGVSRNKIFTLSDGIEISKINSFQLDTKVTREDIGLKDSDFVIISVNRFDAIKGLNYLIEAFSIIKKEIGAKLILIGAGPEERKLKYKVDKLGISSDVLHFKNVEDSLLYNYLSLADIYVSPSLQNCLLLSVLEGMACSLPVVSTDSQEGAVREGINGTIIRPRDPKAIADAIMRIYDQNAYKRMGIASKEISKNYDWEIIAEKAIKEYERLMKSK